MLHTGRQFGDVLQREGSYRQAFPEDLTDSALRLNGHWDEQEIDEWGSEIPSMFSSSAKGFAGDTTRASGHSKRTRRISGGAAGRTIKFHGFHGADHGTNGR